MEIELIEKKEECELTLKITISKEEVQREFDKKYNKLILAVKVPGFRKGKVPRHILETRYGPAVEKEVIENLIITHYQQAIKENDIRVVSQPQIEEIKYVKKDEPISFLAKVEVKPKVVVSNYKGITLCKKVSKITDKDVENGIRRLQEKHAPIAVVEKPVGKNSIVIFDFEGFKDNKPIPNGSHKDFLLEMGKKVFPQEFERQLVGLKKGREKKFRIKLRKDYPDPNLAGQKITFKVKINEVKERILPALDDEFAKDIGDFNTIKELKEAYKKDLIAAAEFEATQRLKDEIITILASQYSFPLPKILIEKEIDYLILNNVVLQGVTVDDYLKQMNITIDAYRNELRPQAIDRLRKALILDSIAEKENINVGDEEYEEWVKCNFRAQPSKVKEYLEDNNQRANLKEELRIQKTLDFLIEVADIK
ncbi:MAG: trigger factor [bacterium]